MLLPPASEEPASLFLDRSESDRFLLCTYGMFRKAYLGKGEAFRGVYGGGRSGIIIVVAIFEL